jgi:uncharacterized protein (TIGR03118 family)
VADNGTDKSTLYNSAGGIVPVIVEVGGGPTGIVFAGIEDNFLVATDASSDLAPARFIFASEDGQIRAWRGGSTALVTAHGGPDAIYKGLAIAEPSPGHPLLYAADFHNARVDVFNGTWANVTPPGSFVDPTLPDGYAPFGIQTIGTRVFVSYAKQDADAEDESQARAAGSSTPTTLPGIWSRASRSTVSSTQRGDSRWHRTPSGAETDLADLPARCSVSRGEPSGAFGRCPGRI